MLNLTAEAKQAWLAQTRQVNARVTIGTAVYKADKIMSIEYDSGSISGETFQIGSFYQNSIKVVLVGILESLANDNKVKLEFAVKVGQAFEWANMGTFYVAEFDRDRNSNRTTFTAVDASVYLGKNYAPTISFPNSLKNLVTDIANQCGVQVNFASMTHLADVNATQPPSKYTCRQVISMVAQIHGGFARINRNDQLEVTRLMSSDIELSPSHYLLKGLTKNETTYRTDGIIVKIGENEEDVLKVGTTTGSAVINLENPLMTQTLLNEMWRVVSIISYYPFNLKWRGIPNLEAGDWITIVDKQGTRYRVPNLSYKLSFKGGLSAESSANTTATSNVQHKLRGTLTQRVADVEGYVNATGGRSYTGLDVPDNKYLKKGDTWYKPDGDDTAILVYNGEKWEEVASPEVFRQLQADFEALDKQAKEAFEQVDTLVQESPETKRLAKEAQEAVNLVNQEITKLQSSVSDTKTALQNAEQELNDKVDTVTTTISENYATKTELSDTKITLNKTISDSVASVKQEMSETYAVKSDLTTLQGDYDSFKEQTAQKISQQVSSIQTIQTDTTNAKQLANDAYSKANSASQNANNAVVSANSAVSTASQAKSNADKAIADVASLTKTVSSQSTRIDQTSSRIDQVASGVVEVGNKVDSLKLVGENLILNGYGEFGNNKNFLNYIFDGTNSYNNKPSFKTNLKTTLSIGSDRIPIDIDKAYQFSMNIKSDNGGIIYLGWDEYDIDGYYISPTYVMGYPNTTTALARDLNNGDTVVYLESTANWVSSDYTHQNGLIFWNYRDSTGYLYPEGVYSRNAWIGLYTKETVNKTNNTITLKSSWTHGTIKAGTRVSQSNSQGHKYRNYANSSAPTSWTNTSFRIGEDHRLQSPYSFEANRFSPAAKSISFMAMWSYGTSVADTYYINSVELKNIDDKLLIDGINNNLSNNYYQKTVVDSKISTATSGITAQYTSDINTKLANYYDKSTMDRKLTIDGQGIETYVKDTKSQLNNLSIGSENLIINGGNITDISPWQPKYKDKFGIYKHPFYYNGEKNIFRLDTTSTTDENYVNSNRFEVKRNTDYTLSFIGFYNGNIRSAEILFFGRKSTETNVQYSYVKSMPLVLSNGSAVYKTITFNSGDNDTGYIRIDNNGTLSEGNLSTLYFAEVMLVEGTVARKYQPSSAEFPTLTQYTQVKQQADQLSATVYDSASGLVTKTNQLAGKYAIQNLNSYGDVLASLNLNGGNVRIKGGLIDLDGNVRIQDGFVNNLKANSILAKEITAQATTVVNAKIANLDAGIITTGILKGTNLSLNLGTGEVQFQKGRIQAPNNTLDIQVNTGIMKVLNTNGEGMTLQNGNLYFSGAWNKKYGSIEYSGLLDNGRDGILVSGYNGCVMGTKSQRDTWLSGTYKPIADGGSFWVNEFENLGYAGILAKTSISLTVNALVKSSIDSYTGMKIINSNGTGEITTNSHNTKMNAQERFEIKAKDIYLNGNVRSNSGLVTADANYKLSFVFVPGGQSYFIVDTGIVSGKYRFNVTQI